MAFSTRVNDQITDAVTQSNIKVIGEAPAVALDTLFVSTSQALSNAAHTAANAQQQSNVTAQAAANMGRTTIDTLDTAFDDVAARDILTPLPR